jgi:hypothetical protein
MEHVAAWKSSGERARVYARAHGLSSGNLYAWSNQERGASKESESGGSSFVPVRIAPGGMDSYLGSRVTLRSGGLECVIEDAGGPESLASLAEAIRRKVFDV